MHIFWFFRFHRSSPRAVLAIQSILMHESGSTEIFRLQNFIQLQFIKLRLLDLKLIYLTLLLFMRTKRVVVFILTPVLLYILSYIFLLIKASGVLDFFVNIVSASISSTCTACPLFTFL